jgi:hypothetical protein
MNMQVHILTALEEQYTRWEELLTSLNTEQITAPLVPSHWNIKDEIAHLTAWQGRSIERLRAGLAERTPEFPGWPADIDPEEDDTTDQLNDWIYTTNRDKTWSQVHRDWQAGFLRFMELGAMFSENDLLDSDRYTWLDGYSQAMVLIASYDHHQEHLEKLLTWLQEH